MCVAAPSVDHDREKGIGHRQPGRSAGLLGALAHSCLDRARFGNLAGVAQERPKADLERVRNVDEQVRLLDAGDQHLAPEQRAAVVARYYVGLSEAETADALRLPLSTVKWRLHAARRQLRVLLSLLTTN